jgi:magnesium-transporting ATPase (P-type)
LYFADIDVVAMKRDSETPFNSEYKFMVTVHEPREDNDTAFYEGKLVVHVKGAPDRLIHFFLSQARGGDESIEWTTGSSKLPT